MKKYYYFSEKSLEFVEVKNFKAKFIFIISSVALSCTALVFGGYFAITSITNSRGDLASLKNENRILKSKLFEITDQYRDLQETLVDIDDKTENLRIAANLEPLSEDEKLLGVGGGSFDNAIDFLSYSEELNLDETFQLIDKISRQIEFEKAQYQVIAKNMSYNEKLYESIPAIIPTHGDYTSSRFGMRIHPILKVRKMHAGMDFVTDVGTPVYAPGNGKVVSVRRNGGYGLEVTIDHGYGYRTKYAHLSKSLVKRWQKIERGQIIAKSGNSGLSTGPHLHYEISHNGRKLNPARFFINDLGFTELTRKN
jgi:murein DD-endopeptidase MepM/ murein hydrolase activator NlpD